MTVVALTSRDLRTMRRLICRKPRLGIWHSFVSLADAQAAMEAWRVDYNTVRPHSALADRTPHDFATTTEGARRLPPARLTDDLNQENSRSRA